jgi:hypothetical protein
MVEDERYNPHRASPPVKMMRYDRLRSELFPDTGAYYALMFAARRELDNPGTL